MSKSQASIPKYFLYGESMRDVDERFLHVESIAARSRLHAWNIDPHAHRELNHLLFVSTGGGELRGDGGVRRFESPVLICVPAARVHGFRFKPETDGWIVTVSAALLGRITRDNQELKPVFSDLDTKPLPRRARDLANWRRLFETLSAEFRSSAPARRAAIECRLVAILVAALRLGTAIGGTTGLAYSADSTLVSRFRDLIEQHYRARKSIADYAAQLHVSQERLRLACVRLSGAAPQKLLNERRLLESKRNLLYTHMSIQQVADQSGFDDPAYFSRFFTRHARQSPKSFRAQAGSAIQTTTRSSNF